MIRVACEMKFEDLRIPLFGGISGSRGLGVAS